MPFDDPTIPRAAFTSPFSKYVYLKVPFGLAKAPAYFEELMNKVLKDLPFAIASLDDIIIYSKTTEEHLTHLQQVFHKLQDAKLSMKLSKCNFFAKEIQCLGLLMSATDIKPLPSKTEAFKIMKPPRNTKQVWAFLSLMGFYSKFIKRFAHTAKLLTTLT